MTGSRKNPVMYVCVKSAVIRDKPDGEKIFVVKFGTRVVVDLNRDAVGNRVYVKFYKYKKKSSSVTFGWILQNALTNDKIINHAKLYYVNKMRKPVPISGKLKSTEVISTINPGERVQLIASVGDWGLTDRGWTMLKWFEKDRSIFSLNDSIEKVWDAVLMQAVKDYVSAVKRIMEKRYRNAADFKECVCTIDELNDWFLGKEYRFLYGDSGKRRLENMKNELRIDDKWLKEQKRIVREIDKSIYPNKVVGR